MTIPPVSRSIRCANLTTIENGGVATFSVVLNSEPTSNVTIALGSSDATEGSVTPTSLTFTPANGRTKQTVTVKGVDDTIIDGNIAYSIITGNTASSDPSYDDKEVSDVSVTNRDDESVKFVAGSTTINESAGTASIKVQVTGTVLAESPVSVDYTTKSGTASADIDFATRTGTLTWAPGPASTKSFTIPINNDFIGEPNEVFTIELSNPVNTVVGSTAVHTVNIAPNDALYFSVTNVTVAENAGTASVSVKMNGINTGQTVTVGYATSDGTAIAGSDYKATTGTVTFLPNQTTRTFTVPIIDDATREDDETFVLTLGDPNNGSIVEPSTQTVTILANDTATPGISLKILPGLKTTEGSGTVSFKIALDSQPSANVVIGLTSDDISEGTVSPASLTFTSANWKTGQVVTARGVNDFVVDGNILYHIVTAPASSADENYNGLNAADAEITNTDNDTASIKVSPLSGLTTTEGGSGSTSFNISLTSEPTSDVTISLESSDLTEGTVSPASLTFTPENGRTTQTVTIKNVDDTLADGNITYSIRTGRTVSSDPLYSDKAVLDVSVTNIDNEVIKLGARSVIINESNGTATFDVILTGEPVAGRSVSVNYATKDATALAGSDYTATSGVLTFVKGQPTTKTITVPISNETLAEGAETFDMVLSAPTNGVLGYPSTETVTIAANDLLSFSASAVSVNENASTATITVKLNGASTQSVTVNYATSNGTATAGSDYTAKSGTLLFAPGETSKTFTVAIINDTTDEPNETVTLTLSGAVNASIGTATSTLTIIDND